MLEHEPTDPEHMDSGACDSLPPSAAPEWDRLGSGAESDRSGPAWEWRDQLGFFRSLLLTIKEVLTSPMETFSLARREGGLGSPLAFFLIVQVGAGILHCLIMWPLEPFKRRLMDLFVNGYGLAHYYERFGGVQSSSTGIATQIIAQMTFVPLALIVWVFVASAIIHLLLLVFGGARYSYEATFRVMAYVVGACAVIELIPFLGGIVQFILWPILLIVGLARMHETSPWRAALAVLLPGFILLLFLIGTALILATIIVHSGRI
jgi:hypothetical protein